MQNERENDLFPEDLSLEQWLVELTTPGSPVSEAWAEENRRSVVKSVERGLTVPFREGDRIYGTVVHDTRVNDSLLI